jgi:hypothetical protein
MKTHINGPSGYRAPRVVRAGKQASSTACTELLSDYQPASGKTLATLGLRYGAENWQFALAHWEDSVAATLSISRHPDFESIGLPHG